MKKKMSIVLICLTITAVLAACGTKDNKTDEETFAPAETTEAVEETKEDAPDKAAVETKEDALDEAAAEIKDVVDVVIGGDVVQVNDFTTSRREFHLSDLPEIHIWIPDGEVVCTVEDGDSMHFKQYEVTIPTEEYPINCRVELNGQSDCYCGAKHEEAIDYGRYLLDYNWCQFAVCDKNTNTAIVIGFDACSSSEAAGAMYDYICALTDMNIEYIKQQIEIWDQEYTPDVEENMIDDAEVNDTSDNDGLLECDIIPCGMYDLDGNKYVMVSTYDDDDSGECMLMFGRYDGADSPFDYYDLENVANNTYSATNWDKVSVTVTFSDGGMDLSGGTGELEEYNGHYTLQ